MKTNYLVEIFGKNWITLAPHYRIWWNLAWTSQKVLPNLQEHRSSIAIGLSGTRSQFKVGMLTPKIGPGHEAENGRHFRKSAASEEQIEFRRPCRGLSPGKGFARTRKRLDMACRDDKQYFKEITLVQIERQRLTTFFVRKACFRRGFSKISRDPVDGSLL